MNRRPRKMVPAVRNARTMYYPVRVEEVSPEERLELMIEDVESEIFMSTGDNPSPEILSSSKLVHLNKRLAQLQKQKEKLAHTKKNRKRHGAKTQIDEVTE